MPKRILCVICNKTFKSLRYYSVHHKYTHLQKHDFSCDACGLAFWSRSQLAAHHCLPDHRNVNIRKRQVLATRMAEKLRQTKKPYHKVLNDNANLESDSDDGDGMTDCLNVDHNNPDSMFQLTPDDLKDAGGGNMNPRDDMASVGSDVDRLSAWSNELDDVSESLQANILCGKRSNVDHGGSDDGSAADGSDDDGDVTFGSLTGLVSSLNAADMSVGESGDLQTLEIPDIHAVKEEIGNMLSATCSKRKTDAKLVIDESNDDSENLDNAATSKSQSTDINIAESVASDADNSKSTASNSDPRWPMATVLGSELLRCNVCGKEIRPRNYFPHVRRVHNVASNTKRPIKWKVCERCGYKCQDNYKFRRHVKTHDGIGT